MPSPKLTKSFTMSGRLDSEHRHQNETRHDTQSGRGEVTEGETGNGQKADGDESLPRNVVREEARHD